MLAKRLPLLSAFAGGCISTAALLGFWCAGATQPPSQAHQGPRTRRSEAFVAASATSAGRKHSVPDDASGESAAQAQSEPAVVGAVDEGRNAASGEPSSPQSTEQRGSQSPAEPGTPVADVLSHLETSYRQALAIADVRGAFSSPARALTPTGPGTEPRMAEREPAAPPPVARLAAPPPRPAPEQAAVALADSAPPPRSARQADVAAVPPPDAALAPPPRPPDSVPPPDAYDADGARNVYVTNVYQGDVYQGDVYQTQQLAVLQYMQLLALSSAGVASPGVSRRHVAIRARTAFPSGFSSSITNPDNPWGFSFQPPVLVK